MTYALLDRRRLCQDVSHTVSLLRGTDFDDSPLEQGQVGAQQNESYAVINIMTKNGDEAMTTSEGKQRRGFASMSPEKRHDIASKGGRAAHAKGTAHEWTPDEARSAGRKGAQASWGGRARPAMPGELTLQHEEAGSADGSSMTRPE